MSVVTTDCLFNNSTIHSNQVVSKSELEEEMDTCDALCMLSDAYIEYLDQNENLLNIIPVYSAVQTLFSSVKFSNGTNVSNQESIVNGYLSTITIDGLNIENIITSRTLFDAIESDLDVTSMNISGIENIDAHALIFGVSFGSVAQVNELSYTNSDIKLMRVYDAEVHLANTSINNVTTAADMINILNSQNTSIDNLNITSSNTETSSVIVGLNSYFSHISNMASSIVDSQLMYFET